MTTIIYILIVLCACGIAGKLIVVFISKQKIANAKEQEEHLAKLDAAYTTFNAQIEEATIKANKIFAEQHFIATSEWSRFKEKYKSLHEAIVLIQEEQSPRVEPMQYETFGSAYRQVLEDRNRVTHNRCAKELCKRRCAEYFDHLFAYPLDDQQRESIVTLEDNTLVVSAAGSGKTSTIIGKTHYLVDQMNVEPNKI